MDCMDIINIRKTPNEIIIDCLIGNQEKIVIIIIKDYDIEDSVRSMRVDQVFIDCIGESDININSDTIIHYLLPLTVNNNGKYLDNIILIY